MINKGKNILKAFVNQSSLKITSTFKSAVGIVFKEEDGERKILLGKSLSSDDRKGKWCFPGGGVDGNENIYKTVVRETEEETGLKVECIPTSPILDTSKPEVAFFMCRYKGGNLKPNSEFESLDWFDIDNLPKDIYGSNKTLLNRLGSLFGIVMDKKDFIKEHDKLLKVLKRGKKQELMEEAKEQQEEVDFYKAIQDDFELRKINISDNFVENFLGKFLTLLGSLKTPEGFSVSKQLGVGVNNVRITLSSDDIELNLDVWFGPDETNNFYNFDGNTKFKFEDNWYNVDNEGFDGGDTETSDINDLIEEEIEKANKILSKVKNFVRLPIINKSFSKSYLEEIRYKLNKGELVVFPKNREGKVFTISKSHIGKFSKELSEIFKEKIYYNER